MFVVTTKARPSWYNSRSELTVFITISATVWSCSNSVVLRKVHANYSCFDRFKLVRCLCPPSYRVNKLHKRLSCMSDCPSSVWQEERRLRDDTRMRDFFHLHDYTQIRRTIRSGPDYQFTWPEAWQYSSFYRVRYRT